MFDEPALAKRGPLPESIGALAAEYVDELVATLPGHVPYRIGGYSFGGVVAVEMARQLVDRGHAVAPVLLLDAPAGVDSGTSEGERPQTILWGLLESLRMSTYTREDILSMEVDAILELITRHFREREVPLTGDAPLAFLHDVTAIAAHNLRLWRPWEPAPFDGDVTMFRRTTRFREGPDLGWSAFVRGRVHVVPVPGDHATMVLDPFVSTLATCIERGLDRAPPAASACLSRSRRAAAPDRGGGAGTAADAFTAMSGA